MGTFDGQQGSSTDNRAFPLDRVWTTGKRFSTTGLTRVQCLSWHFPLDRILTTRRQISQTATGLTRVWWLSTQNASGLQGKFTINSIQTIHVLGKIQTLVCKVLLVRPRPHVRGQLLSESGKAIYLYFSHVRFFSLSKEFCGNFPDSIVERFKNFSIHFSIPDHILSHITFRHKNSIREMGEQI